jgi:hypothetical protein
MFPTIAESVAVVSIILLLMLFLPSFPPGQPGVAVQLPWPGLLCA